jgi:hypothetical protein
MISPSGKFILIKLICAEPFVLQDELLMECDIKCHKVNLYIWTFDVKFILIECDMKCHKVNLYIWTF